MIEAGVQNAVHIRALEEAPGDKCRAAALKSAAEIEGSSGHA